MVSQYRNKSPLFCCENYGFLGTPEFCKSTAYMDVYSQNNGAFQILNYRANCYVGVGVSGMWGMKVRRSRPACLCSGHPDRSFCTRFFGLKNSANPAFEGTSKGSKTVTNPVFGHLMHSIASFSSGLRYIIQRWGQWHHYNGFTIS